MPFTNVIYLGVDVHLPSPPMRPQIGSWTTSVARSSTTAADESQNAEQHAQRQEQHNHANDHVCPSFELETAISVKIAAAFVIPHEGSAGTLRSDEGHRTATGRLSCFCRTRHCGDQRDQRHHHQLDCHSSSLKEISSYGPLV